MVPGGTRNNRGALCKLCDYLSTVFLNKSGPQGKLLTQHLTHWALSAPEKYKINVIKMLNTWESR